MTRWSRLVVCVIAGLAAASIAGAQAVAPLVREEKPVTVRVQPRPGVQATPTPTPAATATPVPSPTPNPEFVLVAIVNERALTRAQLDRRIAARTLGASHAGTHAAPMSALPEGGIEIGPDMDGRALLENVILADQQDQEVDQAVRQEERQLMNEWVEYSMLADEARRQGFAIGQDEFDRRLKDLDKTYDLEGRKVEALFAAMGMEQAEFESYVYDALLIERLLDRWVELNIPAARFKAVYDRDPSLYRVPAMYRAAHFSVALVGDENAAVQRDLKKLAERVRDRLKKGEDFEKVFADTNDLEMGIFGADVGFFNVEQTGLHPQVRAEIAKMKKGQTSDVITAWVRRDGQTVPESYHVVRILDYMAPSGNTFEEALPKLKENAREVARTSILAALRQAKTHRVITNLGGIPARKIPSAAERAKVGPPIPLTTKGS